MTETNEIHPTLRKLKIPALLVGIVGLALWIVGIFLAGDDSHLRDRTFLSYTYAWFVGIGLPMGAMGLLMIQHLSGGKWGLVVRRILEAGSRTLPVALVLFVPVACSFFYGHLFHWVDPNYLPDEPKNAFKKWWLQTPFFLGRTAVWFVIWLGMMALLNAWSRRQDTDSDFGIVRKLRTLSGPGIIVYALTMTFFVFDWVMSMDVHWYSTMYGFLFVAAQGLTAWCFVLFSMHFLGQREPLRSLADADLVHDLGKLLFAFNMFWAYLAFSQFLIMWSANLPEESPYFYVRMKNPELKIVGVIVLIFHFVIPFTILLNRDLKRNLRNLLIAGVWIGVMRYVDMFWNIVPFYHHEQAKQSLDAAYDLPVTIVWTDFVAPLGIVGIMLAAFIWQLGRRPLLVAHDHRLEELAHSHAH
jgi:hypothetical protein